MDNKVWRSVLGVLLIAAGVAGWFLLPERSEWVSLAFVGLGGFFVSQEKMVAFGAAAVRLVKGVRGG